MREVRCCCNPDEAPAKTDADDEEDPHGLGAALGDVKMTDFISGKVKLTEEQINTATSTTFHVRLLKLILKLVFLKKKRWVYLNHTQELWMAMHRRCNAKKRASSTVTKLWKDPERQLFAFREFLKVCHMCCKYELVERMATQTE